MARVTTSNSRDTRDSRIRAFAEGLKRACYEFGWVLLGIPAATVVGIGFSHSVGEGTRATIFFTIPTLWGAYALSVSDGTRNPLGAIRDGVLYGVAILAAVILGVVYIIEAPISIANIGLGAMEAMFFLLWTSAQPTRWQRKTEASERTWLLAVLLFTTVLSIFIAVAI